MRRRPFPMLLLGVLLLVACAPSLPPAAPSPFAAEPSDALIAAATTTSPAQAVTVTFAIDRTDKQLYAPVIARFEAANPDVRVQFVDNAPILTSSGDSATPPPNPEYALASLADVHSISYDRIYSTNRGRAGLWLDLQPFIAADAAFDAADFYTHTLDIGSDGEHTYTVPSVAQLGLLAYNKALWEAKQLPPPTGVWTWDDLLGAAEQLHQPGTIVGWIEDNAGWTVMRGVLQGAGIDPHSARVRETRLDDPRLVAALERVVGLVERGVVSVPPLKKEGAPAFMPKGMPDFDAVKAAVAEQRVAIFPGYIAGPNELPFATGVLPDPLDSGVWQWVQGYVISAGAAHPDAAWRLVSFLSRNEQLPDWYGDAMPARRSLAERVGFWKKLDAEHAAALHTQLSRPLVALPPPDALYWQEQAIGDAVQAVLYDHQPAAAALAAAQAIVARSAVATVRPTLTPFVAATPMPERAAPGATRIRMSSAWLAPDRLYALAQQFAQQRPAIAVQIVEPTGSITPEQLAKSADCFATYRPPPANEAGALLDLDPLLDAAAPGLLADYPQSLLAPFTLNGKLRGLPLRVALPALHYQPQRFADAGLAPPTDQWVPADLQRTAAQLTARGNTPRFGFAVHGATADGLALWLAASGARLTSGDGDTLQPALTDGGVVAATAQYIDLLRDSSPHKRLDGYTRASDNASADPLIGAGQVAMWTGGDTVNAPPGSAVVPFPHVAGAPLPPAQITAALHIAATAAPEVADACWQWMQFLSEQTTLGGVPARISVAQSDAFTRAAPAGTAQLYAMYAREWAASGAIVASNDSVFDPYWFFRAADRSLQGADLAKEMADAQLTTEQFLACVRGGEKGSVCAKQVDPSYDGWKNSS